MVIFIFFRWYFTKTTAVTLTTFLQFLTVSAAPFVVPRAPQSASLTTLPTPHFSPYYLYFGNSATPKLADAFTSLNMKAATIAFASAPKGKCELTTDLNNLVSDAQAFIAKGGVLSLSFGGNLQNPTIPRQHIQQACPDATSLANLILSAMSTFNTHNLEFDIEDNTLLSDTASATRLAQALVQVKKAFSDTFITYTLGANPSGLPPQQQAYVQAAQSIGFAMDAVMLMTMNMGGTDNVKDSQTAVMGGAAQLEKIYNLQSGTGIKKMGMLPSIGVDNNKQVIDLKGIATLAQFASGQGMSAISYWSFNRDFPGSDASGVQSLDFSSSPDQTSPSQFYTTISNALNDASTVQTGPSSGAKAVATTAAVASVANLVVPPPSNVNPGQKASLPPASAS